MIKRMLMCAAWLVALPVLADDNALKNGDFEKGKFGWDTSPGVRVIDEQLPDKPPNRVLEFNLRKNERSSAWQRIAVGHNTKVMKVTMRMKAGPDYKAVAPEAEQFTIRWERQDGSGVLSTRTVEKGPDWKDISWDMSDFGTSHTIVFKIEIHPGEGTVFLDDVKVERIGG